MSYKCDECGGQVECICNAVSFPPCGECEGHECEEDLDAPDEGEGEGEGEDDPVLAFVKQENARRRKERENARRRKERRTR